MYRNKECVRDADALTEAKKITDTRIAGAEKAHASHAANTYGNSAYLY